MSSEAFRWLRGLDLNQRPLGYEGVLARDSRQRPTISAKENQSFYAFGFGSGWLGLGAVSRELPGSITYSGVCFRLATRRSVRTFDNSSRFKVGILVQSPFV